MARPEDIKKKKKKAIEETPRTYVEVDLSRKNEMVNFLKKKKYDAYVVDSVVTVRVKDKTNMNNVFVEVGKLVEEFGYSGSWGITSSSHAHKEEDEV